MTDRMMQCLVNPVKCRVLIELGARGRATPRELASACGIAQSSLYRHLKSMLEAGVVEIVDQKRVRGLSEKIYAVSDQLVINGNEQLDKDSEALERMFFTFAMGLMREFRDYSQRPGDPLRDGVSFTTCPVHATPDELREAQRKIGEILSDLMQNKPVSGRRMHSIALITTPPRRSDGDAE